MTAVIIKYISNNNRIEIRIKSLIREFNTNSGVYLSDNLKSILRI